MEKEKLSQDKKMSMEDALRLSFDQWNEEVEGHIKNREKEKILQDIESLYKNVDSFLWRFKEAKDFKENAIGEVKKAGEDVEEMLLSKLEFILASCTTELGYLHEYIENEINK